MGYPIIVVIGSKASSTEPKIEIITNGNNMELEIQSALQELAKYKNYKLSLTQM